MRNPGSLVVVGLLALAACNASDAMRSPRGEPAPGGVGKADSAQEASDFERLVALLRADGTLKMPPLGVQHGANELSVEVTVHAADEVKAVAGGLIAEISETYVLDPATGTLIDHYDDDIKVSQASGWNDDGIRSEMLSTIDPSRRDEVAALLDGYVFHFTIYQTASEITAEEIFVYRPTNLDRAVIIRFSYVHA
jgi:hypothetical protein